MRLRHQPSLLLAHMDGSRHTVDRWFRKPWHIDLLQQCERSNHMACRILNFPVVKELPENKEQVIAPKILLTRHAEDLNAGRRNPPSRL